MMEGTYDFSKNKKKFDLEKMRVRANDKIEQAEAVLSQGETRLFSIGDISVIAGQPKSRKTFLVAALAASFLSDEGYLSLNSSIEGSVLILDTEQNRSHVLTVVRRIYRLLKWEYDKPHSEFETLSLREYAPAERLLITELAIETFKPKLVLLDGFADLLSNTNDLEESTEKVNQLMRLSTIHQCHICSVLHTNPSTEKMRGHTGSELQRKAETVLLVTKAEDITSVSPQFCRNIEFKKFAFKINETGLPEICDYTSTPENSNQELFETIFFGVDRLSYSDLKNEIQRKLNVKRAAAEKRMKAAFQSEVITKDLEGYYHLKFDEVEPEQSDLPF
jgi:RecA-family ATPase